MATHASNWRREEEQHKCLDFVGKKRNIWQLFEKDVENYS